MPAVFTIFTMDNQHYFDFLEKMLPSFAYGELDKELLKQFNFRDDGKYVTDLVLDDVAQGDIFDKVPLTVTKLEGFGIKPVKAVLLSNTCDASRREFLNFAPFMPIDELGKINNNNAVKENQKNSLIYFPYVSLHDEVVDLNHIFSVERDIFERLLRDEKIIRKYSLKTAGYYLLLSKLVVLHCRMESEDIYRVS